jgi:predicted N-acyltransferase
MQICQTLSVRSRDIPSPPFATRCAATRKELSVQIEHSETIQPLLEAWAAVQPAGNYFLQTEYLQLLEDSPPRNVRPVYLLLRSETGAPVGLVYTQIARFKAQESLRDASEQPWLFRQLRRLFARRVQVEVAFIGNLLLTGSHGYHIPGAPRQEHAALLNHAVQHLMEHYPVHGAFIKDISPEQTQLGKGLRQEEYTECSFLPNMTLDFPEGWRNFSDYEDALSSKYRVRMRRAVRLLGDLQQRRLSAEEIRQHLPRLNELYRQVMERADFNLQELHPKYFEALAERLGNDFQLQAYFEGDKLVGFYTLIRNYKEQEAHFLGFELAYNHSHQLYLNMLFDMIRQSLDLGAHRLVFARTALEIKSSVGAVPEQLLCYIRARNRVPNQLIEPVLQLLRNDTAPWVQRKPFK